MAVWLTTRNALIAAVILGIAAGSAGGVGFYTFVYARGGSYMTNDPAACMNCHVMATQFASWERSSHRAVATCNDCHVPHDSLLRKYAFKAKDGSRHTAIFTFKLEPQVIRAIPASQAVIYENCIRCHVQKQLSQLPMMCLSGRNCLECHRTVPHGEVGGLASAPNVRRPHLEPVVKPPFTREVNQ